MKLKFFSLMAASLYLASILSGCWNTPEAVSSIPTNQEYLAYIESHNETENYTYYLQLQELISQLPKDEIYGKIEEAFRLWADGQSLIDIESLGLSFSQSLKMNESRNQRWPNFVMVEAEIDMADGPSDDTTLYDQVLESALAAVSGDVYARHMLGGLTLSLSPKDAGFQILRSHSYYSSGLLTESFENAIQPEDEYHAQTIAYEYVQQLDAEIFGEERDPNLTGKAALSYFGINEMDELYIGIFIYGLSPDRTKEFQQESPQWAENLFNRLADDQETEGWLKARSNGKIKVEFARNGDSITGFGGQDVFHFQLGQ